MKSIVYFWKPPATCIVEPHEISTNPYAILPKPVTQIPCSVQCQPLEFLNTTTKSCERCELGSVTKNGRYVVDFWEEELPIQMYSHCDSLDGTCEKWTSRGDYIDSGDNDYKILTNSTLEFNIEVFILLLFLLEGQMFTFCYRLFMLDRFLLSINLFLILPTNYSTFISTTDNLMPMPIHYLLKNGKQQHII